MSLRRGVSNVIKKNHEKSDFKLHKLEAREGKRFSSYQCDYEGTTKQKGKKKKIKKVLKGPCRQNEI